MDSLNRIERTLDTIIERTVGRGEKERVKLAVKLMMVPEKAIVSKLPTQAQLDTANTWGRSSAAKLGIANKRLKELEEAVHSLKVERSNLLDARIPSLEKTIAVLENVVSRGDAERIKLEKERDELNSVLLLARDGLIDISKTLSALRPK